MVATAAINVYDRCETDNCNNGEQKTGDNIANVANDDNGSILGSDDEYDNGDIISKPTNGLALFAIIFGVSACLLSLSKIGNEKTL